MTVNTHPNTGMKIQFIVIDGFNVNKIRHLQDRRDDMILSRIALIFILSCFREVSCSSLINLFNPQMSTHINPRQPEDVGHLSTALWLPARVNWQTHLLEKHALDHTTRRSPCVVQARRSPQARSYHASVGHVRAPDLRVDFMSPVETRLVKARIGLDFDQSQDITEKNPFCLYDFFS
jgi:hypothetical protein